MNFIKEFWEFLIIRKKYWLFPIIIVLVLLGGLIIISGILILIGGLAMIGTPAPEGVERNPLMLFAPAVIQLVLGAIKIVKS